MMDDDDEPQEPTNREWALQQLAGAAGWECDKLARDDELGSLFVFHDGLATTAALKRKEEILGMLRWKYATDPFFSISSKLRLRLAGDGACQVVCRRSYLGILRALCDGHDHPEQYYFKTWPKPSHGEASSAVSWAADDVARLRGTSAHRLVSCGRRQLDAVAAIVERVIKRHYGAPLDLSKTQCDTVASLFSYVVLTFESRAFSEAFDDEIAEPGQRNTLDGETVITMTTCAKISAKGDVLNAYGPNGAATMLFKYGFAPWGNGKHDGGPSFDATFICPSPAVYNGLDHLQQYGLELKGYTPAHLRALRRRLAPGRPPD
ncbi:hypothetical protein SO694_00127022 [Aureococcus anophagefferens]|uniref:Rubisco LSMT substrate-binding domain-containing protein n=1 Tax=Aureococcus anophagefferens TaxID=44056 RepID=A0ABR1G2K4_AURAN